ncbi:MAG: aldehyde dehydrogenase family protein [Ornithinimicrobium sp.]|uniref:aldehyde dehydrogenase family protein n=1 Tax=Ornithinimicrobium sp. TaxID=1977084 RepID=UPI0026E0D5AE|nr:aldehyde dehydrogenase family protein [Ornithinimicrobium sp.]MDO5739804.1 aldehyde dehydrogenase family protein [Ornithinimicrobium sp.]
MSATTHPFIGGAVVAVTDTYDNVDPADGSVLGAVARSGADEVDQAVQAAATAQPGWANTLTEKRADALAALADLIDRDREQLARTESEDTGKPMAQAVTDATVAARYFRFYSRVIESYYGQSIPLGPDTHVYTRREPFGVVGSIVAWNYPLQLASRSIAAATATGNAIVLKPADETPRTAVALARLAIEAGIPAGIVNVVPGLGVEAGAALTAHPGIAHLGFVGSAAIGSLVAHAAADRVVPTVLELGGKSAHVVYADADLDRAAEFVTKGILQNAGQTCSAGSRLIVHESVRAELVAMLADRFRATSLGRGSEDPDLGPLISRKQQDRVRGYVEGASSGEVVVGGGAPQDESLTQGSYWLPTLIDDVDPASVIAQEEVFGPVLITLPFTDDDEAVALANGTDYGLISAIWTKDVSRAHRVATQIQSGQVYVNTYGAGGGVELPFGGFKHSGYGREKGVEALDAFTQTKTVVIHLG